ncbi:MAG: HIT domain-containing protein [Candidatus Ozemobacteraceae bacterium]
MFCRIIKGEIPSDIVYRDETVVAFRDVHPQAPVHVLVVPLRHIPDILDAGACDANLLVGVQKAVCTLASQLHLEKGFRLVINKGIEGGQTVSHLHFHLLGQRIMTWPPG